MGRTAGEAKAQQGRETSAFPEWPPGLWRRIVLQPAPGSISAALEDDMHRFDLRLDHDGERVTGLHGETQRAPWTACPGAGAHLAGDIVGERLADVARHDPFQHCTHLFDLAILCAAHAGDAEPIRLDMKVADRVEERTTATLAENGLERLRWQLDGTVIAGPARFAGLDLRQLSQWKRELAPQEAEWATVLRRAVFISGGRHFVPPPGLVATDMGPQRMGACFNYQLPQAADSTRNPDWLVDFSVPGHEPLKGFDPRKALAGSGRAL